ncbi:hypothetical protein A1O3_06639 [Capronia epimyces CBS 606.96]|uniref:Zn(2)-C6 fungal-type domain-containing protein n=1 Tax=Capronia epimyces CBS 606.96 TaxID=1182542 RepID=W9YKP2_9EURO|nr:uncharacterized protein A1O3_06639 [Capronia epimyces CBS 606.96]EXJ82824.1 hypothetical protein A1O3_06639 [Capronia epimyces CBS 606.96]
MDSGSAAAQALRESFGDRRPIDISRKITACVACRRQKIKCQMTDASPPCTRCKKRGLSCVVNRSLQTLLESDVTWKSNVEQKLRMLQDSIDQITQNVIEPPPQRIPTQVRPESGQLDATGTVNAEGPGQEEQGWEVVMDLNKGPAVVPASCVFELSTSTSRPGLDQPSADNNDLINCGIIGLDDAEAFFSLYIRRLDHFLYGILAEHDSLASVRKSSSLLTAAICAVAALHTPSPLYQACYKHFVNLASSRMFSKTNSHDDVRALCIGAFWLSDISWALVGTGELNLHRCIPKAPHTKKACYLRTRLYYLVYVCDHHFSIAYGRPPLTRDFASITSPAEFLKSQYVTEDDVRLVSQVEIWSISTRVFDQFGLDPEAHLSDSLTPQLRRLSIALDTWRADWNERFQGSQYRGNYPRKAADLHYYFAKLFLYSHLFRGATLAEAQRHRHQHQPLDPDLEEFASFAIHAATSILRIVVADQEIQSYLPGLPAYFDTMIAFAFVFLLKTTIKNPANVQIDKVAVSETLDALATVLKDVTVTTHPRHLLTSIASSMRKLLDRFLPKQGQGQQADADGTELTDHLGSGPGPGSGSGRSALLDMNPDDQWLSPADATFLEHYDFLYSPSANAEFDFGIDLGSGVHAQ